MPPSATRAIRLGFAIPLGVAAALLALARSPWTPGPGPGGAGLAMVAAFVAIPLATGFLVQGTREAVAALRALGWRAQPAEWLLAGLGGIGSVVGVTATAAFFVSCLLGSR